MRNTAKNPSGKWVQMNDQQLDKANEAFQRAVARQLEKDRKTAESKKNR